MARWNRGGVEGWRRGGGGSKELLYTVQVCVRVKGLLRSETVGLAGRLRLKT